MRFIIYGKHNNDQLVFIAGCDTPAAADVILNAFVNRQPWKDVFVADMESEEMAAILVSQTSKFYNTRNANKSEAKKRTDELDNLVATLTLSE